MKNMTITDTQREAARRNNGQFGERAHSQPEDVLLTATTTVTIGPCNVCGRSGEMSVNSEGLAHWRAGTKIQLAFPELNEDEREMLMNGTHPECWATFMGDEDETDDDVDDYDESDESLFSSDVDGVTYAVQEALDGFVAYGDNDTEINFFTASTDHDSIEDALREALNQKVSL